MRLQDNPYFLLAYLPPIVNRVKSIGECLLAVGATVALATLTRFPVFIGLIVASQWTRHGFLEQELFSSPV